MNDVRGSRHHEHVFFQEKKKKVNLKCSEVMLASEPAMRWRNFKFELHSHAFVTVKFVEINCALMQ